MAQPSKAQNTPDNVVEGAATVVASGNETTSNNVIEGAATVVASGNEITPATDNVPTTSLHKDPRVAALAASIKKNVRATGAVIGLTSNGAFRMPNGETVETLDLIIVDYRYRNQHYPKPYSGTEMQPCDCFAVGREEHDYLVPHESVENPYAERCMPKVDRGAADGCPKNDYKTALVGKGKACQNQMLIGCIRPGDDSSEIFILRGSPTALKQLRMHVSAMTEMHDAPLFVVTRFINDISREYPRLVGNFLNMAEEADVSRALNAVGPIGDALEAPPVVEARSGAQTAAPADRGRRQR